MKKRKIAKAALAVLSIMTIGATGASLAACGDDDKHEHSYGAWYISTEPTLTDGGQISRDCVNGDDKQTQNLSNLSDTDVWTEDTDAAVGATHTTDGSRTFNSSYGSVTITVPKDENAHDWGDWKITKDPTLTDKGKASHKCEDTDAFEEEIDIPNLNDKVWTEDLKAAVEATHTKDGSRTFNSVYGTVTITVLKNADAHDWGDWKITKDPTLTDKGKASHKCTDTDAFEEEIDIPNLNDDVWTENLALKVDATCAAEGKRVFNSVYGKVELTVPVDASKHNFGAWTFVDDDNKPTLERGGKIQRVCDDNPAHKETEDVPALTDTEFWKKTETTPATHQTTGVANFSNAAYDIAVLDVVTPPAEHTYGKWTITTEPTMDGVGEAQRVCDDPDCAEDETAIETKELKALSDPDFWKEGERVEAGYDHAGTLTYVNETYGSVTVETEPKLPAPYDNKVYSSVNFDVNDSGVLRVSDTWSTALLTIGGEGQGIGTGYPYMGKVVMEFLNFDTGLVRMTRYAPDSNSDSGYKAEPDETLFAYVDKESGILVMQYGSWAEVNVAVPSETPISASDFKASLCLGDFLISHKDGLTIFVTTTGATLNVTFEDINGTALEADTCFNQAQRKTVFVKKDGEVIKAYAYNAAEAKWVAADGLQGIYTVGDETIKVNGGATVDVNGTEYTYTVVSNTESSKVIGVIMGSNYCEYALSADGTFEKTEPKVTITYDFGDYTPTNSVEATVEVSKAVPMELAVPEHATMQFKGWKVDGVSVELNGEGKYAPMGDVTLTAVWAAKVELHLTGLLAADGGNTTIYVGSGDTAGEHLTMYTKYQIDEGTNTYFDGWYYDGDGDGEYESLIQADLAFEDDDTGTTIYAKWVAVPAYVGSYKGSNTYSKNSCTTGKTIAISIDGKISGKFTGKVVSYDPETQLMQVTLGSSSATYYFVYDSVSGILVTGDSESKCTNPLSYDKDTFSTKDPAASFGLKNGSSSTDYNVYIINVENKCGTPTILIYNNKVYGNITVKDALGTTLDAKTIGSSNTVVVRDATTDEIILAVASKGVNFDKEQQYQALDEYFGTYTGDGESLTLDGVGSFVWGDKSGTYAKNGEKFELRVVVDSKDTEYWEITLGEGTYTAVKPEVKVTVTMVAPQGVTLPDAIDDFNVNINVNAFAALPDGSKVNTAYVFNGYFKDSACTQKIEETFVATENVEIFAKYSNPATLTLVFNDGATEDEDKVYSVGDIATLDMPVFAKHAFVGWFTKDGTSSGDWGDEWTNGSAVTESKTIYAKWEAAPLFNDTYAPIGIYGTSTAGAKSSLDNRNTSKLVVDPYGFAKNPASYPFNSGDAKITYVDGSTTKLKITLGTSTVYNAVIDPDTGIIVMAYNSGASSQIGPVWLLNNKEEGSIQSKISSSYWNSGKNRAIVYKFDDDTSYNIYIADGEVYFGVSFKDAATGGNDIKGEDCFKAAALYVIAKDGTILEQPDITVTFDYNGHGTNETVTINKFIAQDISKITPTAEGFVFRGWYTNAGCTSAAANSYVTGVNATLYAKWDEAATVTFHYGAAGHEDTVYTAAFVNDTIGSANVPTVDFQNGNKVFVAWYTKDGSTDGDWGSEVNGNTKITTAIVDVYAQWVVPAATAGSYKGWNMDDAKESGTKVISSQSTNLTISAVGKVTGNVTSQLSAEDMAKETGAISIGKYAYVDKSVGVIWYPYGSSSTSVNNDTYILFNTELVKQVVYAGVKTTPYTFWATVVFNDTTKADVNIFGYNNVIYTNVTWSVDMTADQCNVTNHIVRASDGSTIAVFKNGQIAQLDGNEGTYAMGSTQVVVDGVSTVTLGSSLPDEYTVADGKLVFVHNNQMHVLALDKDNMTCAYVQDGYAGEYTLPDDGGTITLDGLGKVAGTDKTYVVSGTNITVYDGEAATAYGIDVANKQFLGKSVFAGLKFTGTDNENSAIYIEFSDSSSIDGTMGGRYGSTDYTFNFTDATYSDGVLTFTISSVGLSWQSSKVGTKVTATVDGNTITVTSSFNWNGSGDMQNRPMTKQ